jgi:catechol 2,3-dioxygenase-like lactoylglutathione lyase family enzyme
MSAEPQPMLESRDALLGDARLVSLTIYVNDLARAQEFYGDRLGLRVAERDDDQVSYDAGTALLSLRRAADDGIVLPHLHDDASDVVFLVEDVEATRTGLEGRGVRFERQRTYGIGSVIDFYDPDGHRLMLYEPSAHALTTPAKDTMRAVWRAHGRGGEGLLGPAAAPGSADPADQGLDGKPLIYVFAFVKDIADAREFYEEVLGLSVLERSHCCNDDCPDDEKGVVKYEGGGVILSTHHLHGHEAVLDDYGTPYGARDYEPDLARGVAPVFAVDRIGDALDALRGRGVEAAEALVHRSTGVGVVSPSGHLLYIREGR